ncbi:MAG: DNA topology modulation protein [Clostridia bacterium]
MKIAVIGYSGSGKSTTAKHLADFYKAPVLFLDTVQFLPNWVERDLEEGKKIVKDFMEKPSWIIDGAYTKFYQAERFEQADQIIFFNFNRFNCLYRCIKRYFKYRGKSRESITKGCNEKIDLEFFLWIIYRGRDKKTIDKYKNLKLKYPKKIIEIKNQKQLDEFLANLS